MSRFSRKPNRSDRQRSVPPLPHPSWNVLDQAPDGPPRTFSAGEFWRAVGF